MFLAVFCTFFLSYRFGLQFRILDKIFNTSTFQYWLAFRDAEWEPLAISRFVNNLTFGIFYHPFFMGEGGSYTSQSGMGVWLLALIPSILHLDLDQGVNVMLTLVCVFNACISSLVAIKVRTITGYSGMCIFIALSLQPYPSTIMSSIYWFFSLKLVPALALFIIYKFNKVKNVKWWLFFIALSVITFGSGYEFITTTLFSCIAIWLYFALKEVQIFTELNKLFILLLSLATAFLASLSIHLFLLYKYLGDWEPSWNVLQGIIGKRTGGIKSTYPDVYLPSLKSSPTEVLGKYLDISIFGSPTSAILFGSFSVMTLILLALFVFISTSTYKFDADVWQLNFVALVSLLGTFGWVLLARPHAYIHDFIVPAIWYLYSVPILASCVFDIVRRKMRRTEVHQSHKVVAFVSLTLIIFFYIYSYLSKISSS